MCGRARVLYVLSLLSLGVCVLLHRVDCGLFARAWPVLCLLFGCPVLPCLMSPDCSPVDRFPGRIRFLLIFALKPALCLS